ncbi:MAG TPA: RNA methyltransferase [Bdellovibrionales bacterium]|nr:RNA methyltransferase [Bdellovibrionales bacterium]
MDQDLDFRRAKLSWSDRLRVGELDIDAATIVSILKRHLTDERIARLESVVAHRTRHLMPVLENIYDRGNVSAVMRSSEAFGFIGMHLIDRPDAKFKAANRVSKGAEKWLDVRAFSSPADSVKELRAKGYQIWATDLDTRHEIGSIDFSKPTAIVLGNEKDGVSEEMKGLVDGRFRVPMLGFSQSFNISVAAALIFYHAHLEINKLGEKAKLTEAERAQVLANYYLRCFDNPEALLRANLKSD